MRSNRLQSGFAMLLVLIITSAGFILGMSYLSVASVQVQVSQNYQTLARARYIAESGLEHALYVLRFSPEDFESPLGPFYVDGSSDSYTIGAQEDSETPGLYTLTSTAMVGLVSRTSSITAFRSDNKKVSTSYGVVVDTVLAIMPMTLTVNGNVHINGQLLNMAVINGDASGTDGISDPLHRITGSITGDAEEVSLPDIEVEDYIEYTLGSSNYGAEEFTDTNFEQNNPLANGGAVTPNNVGGVVYLTPSNGNTVKLHSNLNFTGTLIIDGNVELHGHNITLTAVDGFPAIVATGAIRVTNSARNVTINGAVVTNLGVIPWGSTSQSSTTVNGAVISDMFGYASQLGGTHVLNYDEDIAKLYDFSAEPGSSTPVVTVQTWND